MRVSLAVLGLLLLALPLAAAPAITDIQPPYGWPFGGNTIAIIGSGFSPSPVVTIGGSAVAIVSASDTRLVVQTPPHAAGVAEVVVRAGGAQSSSTITYVTNFIARGDDYVRYLLPIAANHIHGAYGSVWNAYLAVRNDSDYDFLLAPPWPCDVLISPCPITSIYPAQMTIATITPRSGGPLGPALFLHVPRPLVSRVSFQARIQDESRETQTWGTELPFVNVERDYAKRITLLDIPADDRFRSKLRIYGPSPEPVVVHARIFEANGTTPLIDRTFALNGYISILPEDTPGGPSYGELDPIPPALAEGTRLRAEVEAEVPIWAFVAVTNNETQHVTTLTPRR